MAIVFIFLFLTAVCGMEFSTILERASKRSDGLVHDLVQQMVAEQIERQKILKAFREMKNDLSDVKREIKERNTLMRDTKFLQKRLLNKIKDVKQEAKEESLIEVKKTMNSFNMLVKNLENEMKNNEKSIKKKISETNRGVTEMKKKSSKHFEMIQKVVSDLQRKSSDIGQNIGFTVQVNNSPTTSSAIIFQTVKENIGGGYNTSDGIFYCPKAGLYMFSVTLMSYRKYYVDGYIMKNNQKITRIHSNIGSRNNDHPSASSTIVLRLVRGDEVWVKGGGIRYHGDINLFTGVFIKP